MKNPPPGMVQLEINQFAQAAPKNSEERERLLCPGKDERKDFDLEEARFLVQEVLFLSTSLQIKEASILLKRKEREEGKEAASVEKIKLDDPGDIRDGIFLLFESKRRPHRYHGKFYSFDKEAHKGGESVFLKGFEKENERISQLLKTPKFASVSLKTTILSQTKPNKLILGFEEEDSRCFRRIRDFFGKCWAKVEDDPLRALSIVLGGASRVAKAVLTHGATEIF